MRLSLWRHMTLLLSGVNSLPPTLLYLYFFLRLLPSPACLALPGRQISVFSCCGNKAVMASHLLQYLGQAAEVAIGKMLGLPQVQDHSRRTGFGGKVVQISEWDRLEKGGEWLTGMNGFSWMRGQDGGWCVNMVWQMVLVCFNVIISVPFFHFDHKHMMETWQETVCIYEELWGWYIYIYFF